MLGCADIFRIRAMTALTAEMGRERTMSDFHGALTRGILVTERLRVKAVLATLCLLMASLTVMHLIFPNSMERIWRGHFEIWHVYAITFPLIIFELTVLWLLKRRIALNQDVPVVRRYLSALIETSLPTIALAVQINAMGAERALGYTTALAYFVFIILSTLRLDFWLSTFTGLVAAVELFAMAMLYHPEGAVSEAAQEPGYNIVRSILLVVGGVLAGAVGLQLRRQFEASIAASTARDRVTNLFGQHVSPQMVERLLAAGAGATSEVRHVAIMFVDFRNFTGAARVRTPQEVVDRLDGVFAVLVDILDRHHGIVNKFLGDGFLALFGAPIEDPDAARRAVEAARRMLEAMAENNAGNEWQLRIGIGVHMGNVVAGNVGSPRRKEYTVIGDTVNFAARLESLNKDFGSQFLISSAVREALGEDCSDAASLGAVPIKGYDQPQTVWKLG
jgi:adenylate cyclase